MRERQAAPATSGCSKKMSYPHISKVEITNFRNFGSFSLAMEPTSVILGENRVGKTNFIRALRLVLDPSLPDSQRELRAEDFFDQLESPFGGNVVEVKVFLRGFEGNKGAKSVLADCIVEQEPLTATLTYRFRPRAGTVAAAGGEADYEFIVFGGHDEKTKVAGDVRRWLALMVLPALRDAETDLQAWRKSPLRPLLERVRKTIPPGVLEEVRAKLDEANTPLLQEASMLALVKAINDRIRDLAGPLHHVVTEFDFASSEPAQLLHAIRLFVSEAQTRAIGDVSLGTSNILFLALLLQELESREAAKEIATSILAIEEPEAHLHPQLQRQIFRNFLRRQHSVLVTTHSPSIASVAPLSSIVLLRRVGKTTKPFTAAGLNLTTEQVNDLQRYLDVTRAEILFAKGIILVEGAAEQFLIPAFAADYLIQQGKGTSLDDYGIAVCSVNGTDFTPYHRLLSRQGLCIPHVIVTDGDQRKSADKITFAGLGRAIRLVENEQIQNELTQLVLAENLEQATNDLEGEGIFVGSRTLELDLVDDFSVEIQSAYAELNPSRPTRMRFKTAVEGAVKRNEEQSKELVIRIERVGKGRFAQRLAEKVAGKQPPGYLKHAIERIVKLVEESHA
jgi:putative ATP-dependent endonuclease of OLD family